MTKTYTIADLCALPNDALDALAAELRGWRLEEDEYPPELAPMRKSKTVPVWIDSNGRFTGYAPASLAGYLTKWKPTTDFNQSRELLAWATANCYKFSYSTFGSALFSNVRVEWVSEPSMEFRNLKVIGNDARAEVTAFCAAILAMAAG